MTGNAQQVRGFLPQLLKHLNFINTQAYLHISNTECDQMVSKLLLQPVVLKIKNVNQSNV